MSTRAWLYWPLDSDYIVVITWHLQKWRGEGGAIEENARIRWVSGEAYAGRAHIIWGPSNNLQWEIRRISSWWQQGMQLRGSLCTWAQADHAGLTPLMLGGLHMSDSRWGYSWEPPFLTTCAVFRFTWWFESLWNLWYHWVVISKWGNSRLF